MGTILGIELGDGSLLAGDRIHVADGIEVSERVRRVFEFETAGAAAVGDPGAIDEFRRRLSTEARRHRIDHGGAIGIERLAHAAAPIANATGVDAIVSALEDGSIARIRSIGRDGSVLSETRVAFGSGARLALGSLDDVDSDDALDDVEGRVRELLSTISDRDPETGTDIDVWTLVNPNRG